jgi:homoserine dehydrogenase
MSEHSRSYAKALAEAQALGYAEADPTLDVDGTDSAHKLAILAQIAFGMPVPVSAITRRGIADIDAVDVRFARELGYTIKLLAEGWLGEGQLALHVAPVLLRRTAPLALVRGAYNAILVVGDAVGDALFYGKGAGQMPTASAVVADLIDVAVGRAQRTFHTLRLWSGNSTQVLRLRPAASVRSRFYLRLLVEDRPGVLAEVAGVLAQHAISIASVVQHEVPDEPPGQRVQLVIMTHTAPAGSFQAACARLDHLGCVAAPGVHYPVAD